MTSAELNNSINNYVRDNVSPKPDERDYISGKYSELKAFLKNRCFQTGSYARYTANHPVHDLDVIYVVDPSVYDDPAGFMTQLRHDLEESDISNISEVKAQTHSVTILFSDNDSDFSIDVVPAIETNEEDEFGKPIYIVPEILEVNKHHREQRYTNTLDDPIKWIKSDPRGYVKAASLLNKVTPNFRHATKMAKAWRLACKKAYGDDFRLKSFHLELIFFDYYTKNPDATTYEALVSCLGNIPRALNTPQFPDRANTDQFVDEYVTKLLLAEKQLIVRLQTDALEVLEQLPSIDNPIDVEAVLDEFVTVKKGHDATPPAAAAVVVPRQPWGC